MKKYLWYTAFLILLSAVVTVHHEKYAQNSTAVNGDRETSLVPAPDAPQVQTTQAPQENSPGWNFAYLVFGWPGGITVLALFVTMVAIAEQSYYTGVAANATRTQAEISRQALVAQFRPKIVIREMRLDPPSTLYFDRRNDGIWNMELQLHNSGGTAAHVQKCIGWFQIHSGDGGWSKDNIACLYIDTPFDIPAGGKHQLDLRLPPSFREVLAMQESFLKADTKGDYATDFLAYHGTITYRDDNGLDRDTGFSRNLYMKSVRFLASNDPTAEYQD